MIQPRPSIILPHLHWSVLTGGHPGARGVVVTSESMSNVQLHEKHPFLSTVAGQSWLQTVEGQVESKQAHC